MRCKGICHRYKAPKRGGSKYLAGQKRCKSCGIFIEWNGLFCPCCGLRLRVAPNVRKYKEKVLNFSRI